MAKQPLPHPLDGVNPEPYDEVFKNRENSQFVDPCKKAAKASYACLDHHDYDKDRCTEYFQAYRDCKKAWMEQRKADRRRS